MKILNIEKLTKTVNEFMGIEYSIKEMQVFIEEGVARKHECGDIEEAEGKYFTLHEDFFIYDSFKNKKFLPLNFRITKTEIPNHLDEDDETYEEIKEIEYI